LNDDLISLSSSSIIKLTVSQKAKPKSKLILTFHLFQMHYRPISMHSDKKIKILFFSMKFYHVILPFFKMTVLIYFQIMILSPSLI
jgi:hypothetical protein